MTLQSRSELDPTQAKTISGKIVFPKMGPDARKDYWLYEDSYQFLLQPLRE